MPRGEGQKLSEEHHRLCGSMRDYNRPSRAKPPEDSSVVMSNPRCPKELSESARTFWKSAVKLLRAKGTLAATDAPTLTLYAICSARYLKATLDVDARGFEIAETRHAKNRSEYTVFVPNPSLRI
jgi:phage terminase small subunit